VKFAKSYVTTPQVVCWLTGFDMIHGHRQQVEVQATRVDATGFTMVIQSTVEDVELVGASATWISIPYHAPGVFVGTIRAQPRYASTDKLDFGDRFQMGSVPQVAFGLHMLNHEAHSSLRIDVVQNYVKLKGLSHTISTWGSSEEIDKAKIDVAYTVVALEDYPTALRRVGVRISGVMNV
jgi:hypothetical protein